MVGIEPRPRVGPRAQNWPGDSHQGVDWLLGLRREHPICLFEATSAYVAP